MSAPCIACNGPSTWAAFIVFCDLPPLRMGRHSVKPPDTRCPTAIYHTCDACQSKADGVTGADMLRESWPTLSAMFVEAGVPVPPMDKARVQWERVIAAPPDGARGSGK